MGLKKSKLEPLRIEQTDKKSCQRRGIKEPIDIVESGGKTFECINANAKHELFDRTTCLKKERKGGETTKRTSKEKHSIYNQREGNPPCKGGKN